MRIACQETNNSNCEGCPFWKLSGIEVRRTAELMRKIKIWHKNVDSSLLTDVEIREIAEDEASCDVVFIDMQDREYDVLIDAIRKSEKEKCQSVKYPEPSVSRQ